MRLQKALEIVRKDNAVPHVIFDLKNIKYLTSFAGSNAAMVLLADRAIFITDSRYEEYASSIMPAGIEIVIQKGSMIDAISSVIASTEKKIYLEEHSTVFSAIKQFNEKFPDASIEGGGDIINDLRAVKDESEISVIRKAVDITDKCFSHLLDTVSGAMTEWDICMEAGIFYQMSGCRRMSFDPIVSCGPDSSMPHYFPSMTKRIAKGEMLLIDMGCEFNEYNSDLTRTVFLSEIPEGFDEIYATVLEAQQRALAAVRPGITTGELDAVARSFISDAGYGDFFGHSLGHGVGLDIHEIPAVNGRGDYELRPGNVITVEPGVYLPGRGGVRIEDIVLVTENGHEILTKSEKNLIII